LGQSGSLPFFTDGFPKNDTVIKTRPHPSTKPETSWSLHTAKRMI
jgi:hypothetical protein